MIVSASRRTDIPALYPEWFMNRIREGYCLVRNPFNARQVKRVDLSVDNVDAIVFWSKNPRPIFKFLDELDDLGYRYYFHFTLTALPKLIEPFAPSEDELIASFKALSKKIGIEKVIWRFDPIVFSDLTSEPVIIDTFRRLGSELRGSTSRVVISFVHLYKSVVRNLANIEEEHGVTFHDTARSAEQMQRMAAVLAEIARANLMSLVSCASELDLSGSRIERGKCIDDALIRRIFGITVPERKDKYQRQHCLCVESQDIGQYNTCTHGCVYCYAASNKKQVRMNRSLHDPESPLLIGKYDMTDEPA